MAIRIAWSAGAEADFQHILQTIREDSPASAEVFADKLWDRIDSLREFPLRGHAMEEAGCEGHRDLSAFGYRVIYRVENQTVRVVAIVHGARQLISSWLERE